MTNNVIVRTALRPIELIINWWNYRKVRKFLRGCLKPYGYGERYV